MGFEVGNIFGNLTQPISHTFSFCCMNKDGIRFKNVYVGLEIFKYNIKSLSDISE